MLHLVRCLYYLYQWCTVKQISDNEIYLLIKYIKCVLWRVMKCLSHIEEARCLKVNPHRQRLTFISSVYTHLFSTWRAVCEISVNFLWINFIAVCILVSSSNDSHNHTTWKTNKIHYNVSVLTYKTESVEGIMVLDE